MQNINLVYIIDDDPIIALLIQKMFQSMQLCEKSQVFKNGQEAMDHIQTITKEEDLPNLIFLDLDMPLMDGWGFLDRFIQLPFTQEIPVFILTSSINSEDYRQANNYSIVKEYLFKPINREKLTNIIHNLK